jgi:hypothetical protein
MLLVAITIYCANISGADIKALTVSSPNLISQLGPAFEKYNEEQLTTVKLPGSSQNVRPAVPNTRLGYG